MRNLLISPALLLCQLCSLCLSKLPLVLLLLQAGPIFVLSMTINCFSGTFPEVPGSTPSGASPF